MRTNIAIDDDLMKAAMEATGLTTKRAVVEEALRRLVVIRGQGSLRELRGAITWEGNLDELREDRFTGR
jgi:Arc/MetJ family transcription regulator